MNKPILVFIHRPVKRYFAKPAKPKLVFKAERQTVFVHKPVKTIFYEVKPNGT